MKPPFIQGLDLSELFYKEAVKPLLMGNFPDLPHSAALLGQGSDVLGFDTPQSMDHDWGPRVMLFLNKPDHEILHGEIDRVLREELPPEIRGYPTNYDRHADGSKVMAQSDRGAINHNVQLLTVTDYFIELLNFDPTGDIQAADWVSVPENRYCNAHLRPGLPRWFGAIGPAPGKIALLPGGGVALFIGSPMAPHRPRGGLYGSVRAGGR